MTNEPEPDTKNWTWVLHRDCPECGYSGRSIDPTSVAPKVRANAAAWRSVLNRGDVVSQRPPQPAGSGPKWSALEYGAHVRDVYRIYHERVSLMMKENNPTFPDWDQDAAAIAGDYRNQDPNKVSYDLASNAGKMADLFEKVRDWDATGTRSDGSDFTIASIAVYMVHDPIHNLWDVETGYEAIKEAEG